jgi:hypothetical protein
MVQLMERQYIVVLLFIGIVLILSGSMVGYGLSQLGWVLAIASGVALLLIVTKQRRTGR